MIELVESEDSDVLPDTAASTEEFTKFRIGVAESYFIFGEEIGNTTRRAVVPDAMTTRPALLAL